MSKPVRYLVRPVLSESRSDVNRLNRYCAENGLELRWKFDKNVGTYNTFGFQPCVYADSELPDLAVPALREAVKQLAYKLLLVDPRLLPLQARIGEDGSKDFLLIYCDYSSEWVGGYADRG